MKQFSPSDIADEITKEFGLDLPKSVVRKLVAHHLRYMMKVMKKGKDRIMLRNSDIHTVYREINVKEICGKVADVDETEIPKREKDFAIKHKGFKDPKRGQKQFAKRVKYYKIPKLNA